MIRVPKRDNLIQFLKEKNISTGIHYPNPLPALNAYKYLGYKRIDYKVADSIKNEILSIPLYPELLNEEIEFVADTINKFIKNY